MDGWSNVLQLCAPAGWLPTGDLSGGGQRGDNHCNLPPTRATTDPVFIEYEVQLPSPQHLPKICILNPDLAVRLGHLENFK